MKKLFAFLIAMSFLVAGCGGEEPKLEQHEGIIVDIKKHSEGKNQMLVLPHNLNEDLSDKTVDELIRIAQENGGAYYTFEIKKFEDLQVGSHVIVYWDGTQLESNPPQRVVEKVEVLSE